MSAMFATQRLSDPTAPPISDLQVTPPALTRNASGTPVIRVLIASHQGIVRHGLRALLGAEPDLQLLGEADNGNETVRLARRLQPNLVLMDVALRSIDGISATRIIRAELPDTQVIVMTGDSDIATIEAIRAGAVAYLSRDAHIEDVLRAIRGASAGQAMLPARAVARLMSAMGRHEVLSEREIEVLHLVARGLGNKDIARELGITQSTVKCHVSGILSKLGLASRTQVALHAARTGLVALDDPHEYSTAANRNPGWKRGQLGTPVRSLPLGRSDTTIA